MYVKRLVAFPAETVEIRAGRVLVDGKALPRLPVPPGLLGPLEGQVQGRVFEESCGDRRYLVQYRDTGPRRDVAPVAVPPGHVYVLGDHRDNSRDSRWFGPVPLAGLEGPVEYRFLPRGGLCRLGALEPR